MAAHSTDSTQGQPDGNRRYYERLAEHYELFFVDYQRNASEEGRWLDSVLRARGVRTVLDASCGTGRQAIPLAQLGYQVDGADPSPQMLARAKLNAHAAEVHLPLHQLAFLDLPSALARRFDAVITMGNGLCHQDTAEAIDQAVEALHACCYVGGICLVGIKDFAAVKRGARRFHGHRIIEEDGLRTILFEIWDIKEPLLVSTAFLLEEHLPDAWDTVSATTREYMLMASELERMALRSGFGRVERLEHPSEAVFLLET
ncbi:MAG: class I SAM-dependent methyltransferase [Chloroflexota bacterium]